MITYRLSPWPNWSFHTVSAWTLSASFGGICLHVQHVGLEPLWARLASNRAGQQVAANWSGTTELHWNWKAPKENDQIIDLEQIIWVWPCQCVCVTLFVGILCRIYYRWSKCNLFLAAAILVSWMKGSLVRPWRCQLCQPMAGEKNLSQSFSLCQLRQTGGWGHSFKGPDLWMIMLH